MKLQNLGKRTGISFQWHIVLLLALWLRVSEGAITVGDVKFDSMPAIFGMPWTSNVNYQSHLQSLPGRQFLCKSEEGNVRHELRRLTFLNRSHRIIRNETRIPREALDGLPIALLVSRGGCSFEEKARQAMMFVNVRYVILYDDSERSQLLPMSASNAPDVDIGLMFVSQSTGLQLLQMIRTQSQNARNEGGLVITLDSRVPENSYGSGRNNMEEWILAVLSGFFAFVACIGCLLVCVQAGFLPAVDRLNMVTGERLMTEEQVLKFPTVDYGSRGETRPMCAICIEEFNDGDRLRQLPCLHEFHTECITPWLTQRRPSCPLCKHDVRPASELLHTSSTHRIRRWWLATVTLLMGRRTNYYPRGDDNT